MAIDINQASAMRDRVWKHLVNIKFKEVYTYELSNLADKCERTYSFLLAFTSASSVASWTIWNSHHILWASIIGVTQFLSIAKPYIRFVKDDKAYLEMSFEFERLYLEYERLWYNIENQKLKEDEAIKHLDKLRHEETEIEKRHKNVFTPDWEYYKDKASEKTKKKLEINF